MQEYTIKGRKIKIFHDGEIFVNGKKTKLKQWKSSNSRYSNLQGRELEELKGLNIEEALSRMGKL